MQEVGSHASRLYMFASVTKQYDAVPVYAER